MDRSLVFPIRLLFLLASLSSSFAYASVTGTVIDLSGKPIGGAEVRVVKPESETERLLRLLGDDPAPKALVEAKSDSKGNFELDVDRQLSSLTIDISAPGRDPVRLTVPHDDWVGAVVLRETESVDGRVISGDPVAGALVVVRHYSGAEVLTRTDAQGRFTIPKPGSRAADLIVLHPDYAPVQKRWLDEKDLMVRLDRGTELAGRVVASDGETPVAGARVTIDQWPLATSSEDGSFVIPHAPKQWSLARISKEDLTAAVNRTTARSTTVRLAKAATISGSVVDAESGRGIPDVVLTLARPGELGDSIDLTVSGGSGEFRFPAILPGSYILRSSHPSWVGVTEPVTVVERGTTDRRIQLRRSATVRGRANDEEGNPVATAAITGRPESPEDMFRLARLRASDLSSGRSAPDGRFVLFGLSPEAELRLEGIHPAYPVVRSDRLELEGGETKRTSIIFPRGVSLAGVVKTISGDPVADAHVRATPTESGGMRSPIMIMRMMQSREDPVVTDSAGRFHLKVETGTWDLVVEAKGFAPGRLNALDVDESSKPVEVVLEPGHVVQGRVVRAGIGIPEVMINAISRDRTPEPILTGPDGSFTIEDLPAGSVNLVAVKPDELIQEMRSVKAPESNLLIELPPGGTIRGRVTDAETSEPITDFRAAPNPERLSGAIRIRMSGSLQAFHSQEGSFVIENVPAGRYGLIVDAPGYLTETLRGIEVEEGKIVDDLEIELSRGVEVSGMVRGEDGRPIPGVSVTLEAGEEDPIAQMMPGAMSDGTTDSAGHYTIAAAPPGETTFRFSREGYVTTRKSLELEGRSATLDATLSSGRTVTGTVVSSAGAPISGATVSAYSAGQSSRRNIAETDANGQFAFDGLADGRYTFAARHQRYALTELSDVDISTGQPIRILMDEGGTVVGRVLGVEPAAYASIMVTAMGSGTGSSSPVSPDGTFRIEGVKPGKATVSARMSQSFDNRSSNSVTVDVVAGSQSPVELEFGGGSSVTGRVTRSGNPVRSGMIRFVPRDRSSMGGSANLDAEGRYTLDGLARGTYEANVIDLENYIPFSKTVEIVSDSQTVDIDIRGGRLTGRITNAGSGEPIENASITLERADRQQSMTPRLGATTGASGEFSVDPIPEGSYLLRVERSGFGHATRSLFISEGREEEIELALMANEGVVLRVVDRRDGTPLRASVFVYDGGSVVWEGSPSPREDGTVQIPLAPGTYRVQVRAGGYAPTMTQINSPGGPETIGLSRGGFLVVESRSTVRVRARLVDSWGMPASPSPWNRTGELSLLPGTNRIENLAPGQYSIQILGEDGNPVRAEPVTIREGETATVSL